MLVVKNNRPPLLWELNSILMQILWNILSVYCQPTWPLCHVVAIEEYNLWKAFCLLVNDWFSMFVCFHYNVIKLDHGQNKTRWKSNKNMREHPFETIPFPYHICCFSELVHGFHPIDRERDGGLWSTRCFSCHLSFASNMLKLFSISNNLERTLIL